MIFDQNIILRQKHFFTPKSLSAKKCIFLRQKFLYAKIYLRQNLFTPKFIYAKIYLRQNNFSTPKNFIYTKTFVTPINAFLASEPWKKYLRKFEMSALDLGQTRVLKNMVILENFLGVNMGPIWGPKSRKNRYSGFLGSYPPSNNFKNIFTWFYVQKYII